MRQKCCVGGCNATNETHRLFAFPKIDSLRNLWLSFLVPTNSLLINLTKDQLLRKRVCEKHFDRHQFDREGKRIRYSYPCLFTDDEITHGEPLLPIGTVRDALIDHNYFKNQEDEEDTTEPTLVIGRPGDDFHEHPSCSHFEVHTSAVTAPEDQGDVMPELPRNVHTQAVTSAEEAKEMPTPVPVLCHSAQTEEVTRKRSREMSTPVPAQCYSTQTEEVTRKRSREMSTPVPVLCHSEQVEEPIRKRSKGSIMKHLSSKGRKFVKQVIHIATSSLGQTSEQRLSTAKSYGSNEQLLKNFSYLNKQAQSFVLMQLKQCRNNKMARRFTMDEKLMALMLMKQSPKGYKLLETMFALPNKRTLHRLSERISMKPGINQQVFAHIRNTVKNWSHQQKLCSIVFDEVALTPYLTYDEKNDEIHGFVNVAGERQMKYCDHALVFMVRGICSSWRQCISYYFCEGSTSTEEVKIILRQIVSEVAQTGLIPLGLVCDQGSTFRSAVTKFREETIKNCNEADVEDDGTVNISGHNLNIFFDPPHLLKSMRNNFLNKNIKWEGKTASWKDIQFIYDIDNKLGHTRALPKLTAHHVDPAKIRKVKVSVAAQVFSSRTAAMLNYTAALNKVHSGSDDDSNMEATAEIVEFMDTLFDSVNGSPGGATKGKLRKAVKKNSAHHRFWAEAIKKLKIINFEDKCSKLAIKKGSPRITRPPCVDGWITTLESFSRISRILFSEFGVEYYYPRNINQDPLENFFGRVRALNYRNVKPNANSFIYTFKSLLSSNLLSPHSKFANCEVDNGETLLDVSFLFELNNTGKENKCPEINILPSTSQERQRSSYRVQMSDEVTLEKMKLHCSAYTAGYICRKITKSMDCPSCSKTYISSSKEEHHAYIQFREYKTLKRQNLQYPTENFLRLYREASSYIHNYLNKNCYKTNVCTNLISKLNNLRTFWLGCANHRNVIKIIFLKLITKLHVHNWCNIINKILKGDIEERYVLKMEEPQKLALKKYKSHRLRQKVLNK